MNAVIKKIEEVIPYEKNPRRNDDAVVYVANSIREFGFRVPIVVDKDGVIITGHTRLKAAKSLGMTEVPVIVADDLTEDQVKAYRIADNKAADKSYWDEFLLKDEIETLGDAFDMKDFGFEDWELNPVSMIEDLEEDELVEHKEDESYVYSVSIVLPKEWKGAVTKYLNKENGKAEVVSFIGGKINA